MTKTKDIWERILKAEEANVGLRLSIDEVKRLVDDRREKNGIVKCRKCRGSGKKEIYEPPVCDASSNGCEDGGYWHTATCKKCKGTGRKQ